MKNRKLKLSVITAAAGCACSLATARPMTVSPVRLTPAYIEYGGVRYPVITSGSTDVEQKIYENGADPFPGALGGYFTTASLPNTHELDDISFNPGIGAGAGHPLLHMTLTIGSITASQDPMDVLVKVWDTVNAAASPVTQNQIGATLRLGFVAPAGGWAANTVYATNEIDLTTFAMTSADDQIYMDMAFVTAAGEYPANANTNFTGAFYSNTGPGQTVGSSAPTYYRDASLDGNFTADELRQFAAPAVANFACVIKGDVNAVTGACCLTNGNCVGGSTSIGCAAQGGVYQGDNSNCAAITCPQPGSCCLSDGVCQLVQSAACAAAGGTYGGNGSSCATANCPQPTCFTASNLGLAIPDGVGNGTGGAPADGTLAVAASQVINGISFGVNVSHTFQGDVGLRIVHPDSTGIDLVLRPGVSPPKIGASTNFGFDADNFGDPSTGAFMSIVDNAPNGVYDTAAGFPGPPAGSASQTANVAASWRAVGGSLNTTFNGKNVNGTWHLQATDYAATDAGVLNAFRICLPAAVTSACYPNCDHSTIQPCLNVQDFGCFLNKFANADSYANCDNSTIAPVLNVQDFGCFLNKFAIGCSGC